MDARLREPKHVREPSISVVSMYSHRLIVNYEAQTVFLPWKNRATPPDRATRVPRQPQDKGTCVSPEALRTQPSWRPCITDATLTRNREEATRQTRTEGHSAH